MSQQTIASSAVVPAVPADDFITGVETLCGLPIAQALETIGDIGGATQRAESKVLDGHAEMERLDALLLDWIVMPAVNADGKTVKAKGDDKKYIPVDYRSFMGVRQLFVAGAFDKGAETVEAAAKVWERAIKRCIAVGFVRPVSQDPEALRKAEARKAKAEKLAAIPDTELQAKKVELFEDGSSKAVAEMKDIAREIERRAKDVNAGKVEAYKVMAEAIGKRAKELAKLGTADAENMLIKAGQVLGVKFSK
jgi:hypothetical protein